jgi:hypothetical protein
VTALSRSATARPTRTATTSASRATLRYETPGGTVANLNSAYLHRRFHSFDDEIVIGPAGAPPLTDEFDQRNKGHDFEIGGDIDFALGPGA